MMLGYSLLMMHYLFIKSECPPGHFGVAYSEGCSDHCINNGPCDHVSGGCFGGCQDGYFGDRCFNSKKPINFSLISFEYYILLH